jgi:hypothetical protein
MNEDSPALCVRSRKWEVVFVGKEVKDRLGDKEGGSEWDPIKIILQREN